jgi:hypothetical protein
VSSGIPAGLQLGVGVRVRLVHVDVAGLDGQLPAAGHGVAGVDGQVDQDLLDVAWVGEDHVEARVEVGNQLDMLAEGPLQQAQDALHFARRLLPEHAATPPAG